MTVSWLLSAEREGDHSPPTESNHYQRMPLGRTIPAVRSGGPVDSRWKPVPLRPVDDWGSVVSAEEGSAEEGRHAYDRTGGRWPLMVDGVDGSGRGEDFGLRVGEEGWTLLREQGRWMISTVRVTRRFENDCERLTGLKKKEMGCCICAAGITQDDLLWPFRPQMLHLRSMVGGVFQRGNEKCCEEDEVVASHSAGSIDVSGGLERSRGRTANAALAPYEAAHLRLEGQSSRVIRRPRSHFKTSNSL